MFTVCKYGNLDELQPDRWKTEKQRERHEHSNWAVGEVKFLNSTVFTPS